MTAQLDTPSDSAPDVFSSAPLTPVTAPEEVAGPPPPAAGPHGSTGPLDLLTEVGTDEDPRELARASWRASVAAGQPLTGRELAGRFQMSERWGRDRIAEVRRADGNGTAQPVRRRGNGGTPKGSNRKPHAAAQPASTSAESETATHGEGETRHAGGRAARSPNDAPVAPVMPPKPETVAVAERQDAAPTGARLVAWAGFLFGTVISVAANVLHAWLPALAGETAAPGVAVQVGAAVWPIALVISVEVLSRVQWRPGWTWQLARYGGAGVVAIGAALISYGHLHGVLAAWGYGTTGAAVGPLVVDGLMTISGFALLAMSDHGKTGSTGDGKAAS